MQILRDAVDIIDYKIIPSMHKGIRRLFKIFVFLKWGMRMNHVLRKRSLKKIS